MRLSTRLTCFLVFTFSPFLYAGDIKFSGYGSIKAAFLTDDDFTTPYLNLDDEIDFEKESIFALQATTELAPNWTATILLQADGADDFDLEARWAYVNYTLTPSTTLTIGRFALPFFRSSDTQDIGYSHNYTRLPITVYRKTDFSVVEGIRLTHNTYIGEADISIKGSYASYDGKVEVAALDEPVPSEMQDIIQLSVEYNWRWMTFFLGGFQATWDTNIEPVINASMLAVLPGYGFDPINKTILDPSGTSVYELTHLYTDEDDVRYATVGFFVDYENIVADVEYSYLGIDDSIDQFDERYYVSLGYRITDWIFTLSHQRSKIHGRYEQGDSATDIYVKMAANGLTDAFSQPNNLDSNGIHARYDVADNVALKFEYSVMDIPGLDKDSDLVSFGVDFVF